MPSGTPCGTQRAGTGTIQPSGLRNWATTEQKLKGWEIAVRIENIVYTVLHEAHERQVEETTETLSEEPEEFYGNHLD